MAWVTDKLRWVIAPLRRRPSGCATTPDRSLVDTVSAVRHIAATEAASRTRMALAKAMYNVPGAWAEAEQHIAQLVEIDAHHRDLPELRARVALGAGRTHDAFDLLDSPKHMGIVPRRLLRQLLAMRIGRRTEAHLDLYTWSRQSDCPSAARVLAAWLFVEAGDAETARQLLTANGKHEPEPMSLGLSLLIDLRQGQPGATESHAGRLMQRFGHQRRTGDFLRSLHVSPTPTNASLSMDMIDQLAGELRERPEVIPTLVASQKWAKRVDRIELLRRAIGRIVEDLDEPFMGIEALAELAMAAGDSDAAWRWAIRGLALQPMNAKLALIVDRVAELEGGTGSMAHAAGGGVNSLGILRRVADAHSDYADVQAALVRCYERTGLRTLARSHVERWLAVQPHCSLARQLHREIAA